ncbi:hypothetical protein [Alkaliphilus serpentinus]|uniref:DUF8042 domain-containing protein n=1 Tax=Alkaliphilus serpentinus TaxID=1482731 RepID=A0A833HLS8_9FIRM|nr:hypothetical protein [Alkaliphilus serpentinus]KAB3526630.1 hypothetical protein F8153_13585 [Alkaliphilus serpentinus]
MHLENQINELKFEDAKYMVQDITEAILSIEEAIAPMLNDLPSNNIEGLSTDLRAVLGRALKESDKAVNFNEIIQHFNKWKEELRRILKPYIIS